MKKIFIAIPTTGNIRIELLSFLLNITHNPNYLIKIDVTTSGDICNNRNYLTDRFLQTDSEWLIFIDSDIVPPMNLLDIIDNSKDIISAINFTWKDNELIPLIMKKEKMGYKLDQDIINRKENSLRVDAVGLGCFIIKREVFKKINLPYFEFIYDKKGILINGEDFNFCEKAKKAGFDIWIDKRFITNHFNIVNLKAINNMLGDLKNGK